MAVNKVRRFVNLSKNLDTSGDVGADSIQFEITNADLGIPSITSVHPTANLSSGDLIFLVGTDFDASANVTLISNTGVETVAGNVTFNSTSNVTFTWPLGAGSGDLNPYDVKLELSNKGLGASKFNTANGSTDAFYNGTVSGYNAGGSSNYPPTKENTIDKYPFSSDGNATDVGNLSSIRYDMAGHSSSTNGYTSGGRHPNHTAVINQWPFASDTNASNIGNLTQARWGPGGSSSETHGYAGGGFIAGPNTVVSTFDKFPFSSSPVSSSDIGDLTATRFNPSGHQSYTHGYYSGGSSPPATLQTNIQKFPFSSDVNPTDVADLATSTERGAGQSSTTHGYNSSGTNIQKFSFSTDSDAIDVGNLSVTRKNMKSGTSSTTSGYSTGGIAPPGSPYYNVIDKFPFASDGNASNVGDLTTSRGFSSDGQQV